LGLKKSPAIPPLRRMRSKVRDAIPGARTTK
jgi:hypothetical protein